jgi:hypothetical protein
MFAARNLAVALVALCSLSGTSPAHAIIIGSPGPSTACTLTDSCKDVIQDIKDIIPGADVPRNDD